MSDRFFKKYGNPVDSKVGSFKKSTDAMFRRAIEVQIDIQKGKNPKNFKGAPLKSWFNEDKLLFIPKFGTSTLWGAQGAVRYVKGQELEMLELLLQMHENGELESYLKRFKEKRGV